MNPVQVDARWQVWIRRIYDETFSLGRNRRMFRAQRDIVKTNTRLQKTGGHVIDWMFGNYVVTAAMTFPARTRQAGRYGERSEPASRNRSASRRTLPRAASGDVGAADDGVLLALAAEQAWVVPLNVLEVVRMDFDRLLAVRALKHSGRIEPVRELASQQVGKRGADEGSGDSVLGLGHPRSLAPTGTLRPLLDSLPTPAVQAGLRCRPLEQGAGPFSAAAATLRKHSGQSTPAAMDGRNGRRLREHGARKT